ncbi:MAG: hypothetical protein MNPFHGCM_00117 [Gemmatimonadaceae bacterium]|nr:hypothetical protein [Gemmatimonadaceae bacterium]
MSRLPTCGVLLPLLLGLSPAVGLGQSAPASPSVPPSIVVSAIGEASIQPDRATMMFSVETRAPTAAAAGAENARLQRAVTDALRGRIASSDRLSTAGYSVSTDDRYEDGQRRVTGYIARNTVVLETRSIERVGAYIDLALSSGSNLVSGLRFWASAADKARREALADAVKRARADAEAIAAAAGGSLGQLLEVQSSSPGGPIIMEAMAMRSAATETPISPSEQTVSATVSAKWVFVAKR